VPGFPKWTFALLAVTLIGLGLASRRNQAHSRSPAWISHRDPASAEDTADALASPLAVHLAPALRAALDRPALDTRLAEIKGRIEADLGPVFPRLQVATGRGLDDRAYEVLMHDVAVVQGRIEPGGETPPEEEIARRVEDTVRRHAARLLGLQDVHRLLLTLQREAPELAAEVARVIPAQRMAEVLRRLLQEGIPIRNLQAICESLGNWAQKQPDTIALVELVRIDLGRYITSRHVGAQRQMPAILFDSGLLERVQAAVEHSPRGNLLLLSPAVAQDIRDQVHRIAGGAAPGVVAITSSEVRRYVKTLIEPVVPAMPVLSYQEIDEDVQLQPVGWITNPQAA
jgi:type III secretion protein V